MLYLTWKGAKARVGICAKRERLTLITVSPRIGLTMTL